MSAAQIKTAGARRRATGDRPVDVRVQDFLQTQKTPDINGLFKIQAPRCCQCAIQGCNRGPVPVSADQNNAPGCPLNTRIPDWLREVSSSPVLEALNKIMSDAECGRLTEPQLDVTIQELLSDPAARVHLRNAFNLAMERNVLSEFLGAVCPQAEELCEGGTSRKDALSSCVAGAAGFKPITIGNIENLIGRIGRQAGWFAEMMNPPLLNPNGGKDKKHISIIGGGPAGLASAIMLRRQGFRVSVYFREEHIGGLLMYGLPGTKLDKQTVLAYENILSDNQGIRLIPRTNVGAEEMAKIRAQSDAVILAIGAQTQRILHQVEGQHDAHGNPVKGYVNSLDFLGASIRKHNIGEDSPIELSAISKEVVVIGGGDTAMDCVREAVRQGAKRVTVLYRGTSEQMRAVEKEIGRAKLEGVEFDFQQTPRQIVANEFGNVEAIICEKGKAETVTAIPHKAQLIINATGFTGDHNLSRKLGIPGLQQDPATHGIAVQDPHDNLRAMIHGGMSLEDGNPTGSSSRLFAVGDAVQINGGRCLAVEAVRDATMAVEAIIRRFNSRPLDCVNS